MALIGRDYPLGELRAAFASTAGGAGGCVVIEGPAGIGKSRLLESLAVEASTWDAAVVAGKAAQLDRVMPLATMLGLLRKHAPELRPGVLGDTDVNGLWLVDQLCSRIEGCVQHRRLMVILDDAHWADELTAQTLRMLIPALASSPVLWILARRPGPVHGSTQTVQEALDWLIAEGARQIRLDPLDDAAVALLCEHALGATPDSSVLALAARSDGNPFLLWELLTALRDTGQLRVQGGRVSVLGDDLPSDFLATVHRRLHNLSDRVGQLLDAGAVLGRPFTLHEAGGLLGCRAVDLVPAVTDAVACGILVTHGNELAFRHELLREAFYNALSYPVRSALHREAATVVQEEGRSAVEAAEHLMLCGRPGNERAKEVLGKAVRQIASSAPGTAADLTLRMLELIDEHDADRPQLIADGVRLLATAGRVERAIELGEQALCAGLDAASEGALVVGLAEALKHAGRHTAVVRYTGHALSREGVPDPTRARLLAIRAHALLDARDLSEADQAGMEAAEIGARTGEHAAVVFGLAACSVAARSRGALEEAVGHARQATLTADLTGGEAAQRHPRLWLGEALTEMDQFTEADAVYEMGQREATQLGTAWSQPLWHYYRAQLRMAAGRIDDANAEAEAGLRVCEQLAARALTVPLLGLLAQVAVHRDDVAKACEHLDKAQAIVGQGVGCRLEDLSWPMALRAEAVGEYDTALALLTEIYDGFPNRFLILTQDPLAGAALVRIAQRAGSPGQAKVAASTMQLLAERNPGVAFLAGAAAHAEGLLSGDLATLRSAVQAYRSSPRTLARATVLEDTARGERAAGNRSAAVHLLREALALYESCGARRNTNRVTKLLNRLGVHRTRARGPRASILWDTLSESELRVARLVAQGLTNRQVAARLFLSPHTVDSHLRHSFTKLGVNSRVELTRQVLTHDRDED